MTLSMRDILAQHLNEKVYLFTTQGHVISGTLEDSEEVVTLRAPDGVTPVYVNVTDVSGVRLHTEEAEDVS